MSRKQAFAALVAAVLSAHAAHAQHVDSNYDSTATTTRVYPVVPQKAPDVPQSYALGGRSGSDPHPYFCLPSYTDYRGLMVLEAPGATPSSCTFKSDVKRKDCDCGYYNYRAAHIVAFPSFGLSDPETDRVDHGCTGYSYGTGTNCDEYGRCYSYTYPYCPANGAM